VNVSPKIPMKHPTRRSLLPRVNKYSPRQGGRFQIPGSARDWGWVLALLCILGQPHAAAQTIAAHPTPAEIAQEATLPWALEKQSRSLASRNFGLALDTTVQLGSGVGAFSVGVGLGALAGGSGWAALGGAAIGGAVAIPAYIGGSIYRNITSRHAIEREFDRRRLVLPVNLVSAQTAPGSLFFRVTPGPKSLTLRYRVADEVHDLTVDLAQLAGLHLKSTPVVEPVPRSDSSAFP